MVIDDKIYFQLRGKDVLCVARLKWGFVVGMEASPLVTVLKTAWAVACSS